jgi:hypothetical protein
MQSQPQFAKCRYVWELVSSSPHTIAANLRARIALSAVGISFFLLLLSQFNLPDPDMFHEMSLARAIFHRGAFPQRDLFAYTPTIAPVVHHEWGAGVILYVALRICGPNALLIIRYALAAATATFATVVALSRGGRAAVITLIALIAAVPACNGFATVRAQAFTLCFTAILLYLLEQDRRSRCAWIIAWLTLYVIWLNVHGGFVAGVAIFGAYTVERFLRSPSWQLWHLPATLAAMLLLLLVNPYGFAYPRYVVHAIAMPRPLIPEWAPIWQAGLPTIAGFAALCVLTLYAIARVGWRGTEGCITLVACLLMAGLHLRHASLAAVVAYCYLPGWIVKTPLGEAIVDAVQERPSAVAFASLAISALCLVNTLRLTPWHLAISANGRDWVNHEPVVYPAGAVAYLNQHDVVANVMTPFVVGGFVSWKCYPRVKVSIDGRYEVAYPPALLGELNDCYAGRDGWRLTLKRYPTDIVLVPTPSPLAKLLKDQTNWTCVYEDDAYALWERPGLTLPLEDHRGQQFVATIN